MRIDYNLHVCVHIFGVTYFLILFSFVSVFVHAHFITIHTPIVRLLCTTNTCMQNPAPPCFELGMSHFWACILSPTKHMTFLFPLIAYNLCLRNPALTVNYWRASEASETLSEVYKFELVRYVYLYIFIPPYVTFNARDWSKSED